MLHRPNQTIHTLNKPLQTFALLPSLNNRQTATKQYRIRPKYTLLPQLELKLTRLPS